MEEHLRNPAPLLRQWSKGYRAKVKATIAEGGIGSKPYAASTLKRMQSTGTSAVTARGDIRSDRVKRTAADIKRHAKKLGNDGWSPDWQKKQDNLERRLDSYARAEHGAAKKKDKIAKLKASVEERSANFVPDIKALNKLHKDQARLGAISATNIGKRQSERNQRPLRHMGKTIRAKANEGDDSIVIFSAVDEVGKAQDAMRPFIKTADFDQEVKRLAGMFEHDLEEAFDGR